VSLAARWAGWDQWAPRNPAGPLGGNQALPVTYPTSLLGCKVWIAPGADLTQPPITWPWTDITAYVRYNTAITVTTGRKDEHALAEAGTGELTLDNRDGRFSRRNPASPYYPLLTKNTPILAVVDPGSGQVPRMQMYVSNWPNRSDRSGRDSTVPLSCAGVLRRLGQGSVIKSAARRSLGSAASALSTGLVAYWPLEDQSNATTASTPISGASAGTVPVVGRCEFGDAGPPGASGAAHLVCGAGIVGPYSDNRPALSLPIPTHTAGQLVWSFWFSGIPFVETAGANGSDGSIAVASSWINFSSGTIGSVGVTLTETVAGTNPLISYVSASPWTGRNTSGTGLTEINTYPGGPQVFDGEWHQVQVRLAQSGGDVTTAIYLDGVLYDTATEVGQTLGVASEINFATSGAVTNGDTAAAAGNTVFDVSTVTVHNSTSVDVTDLYDAGNGYIGEQAHERIIRLCNEESVPIRCVGGDTTRMGLQSPQSLIDALREAEAADLGVLYETGFGLGYQCRSERHNAVVGFNLDFAQGQIAQPPAPEDDDQQLRNRWTVTRKGGGEATVEDAANIASNGLYDESADVSLETADQAPNAASWRVHVGTVDVERWPDLSLDFASTAGRGVIAQWLALGFGVRVQVANPPDAYSPYPVDAFIEGVTETWDPISWDAKFNTSPAQPFEVHVVGSTSSNRGRVDSTTSTLTADPGTAGTSLTVATTGVRWIDSATYPSLFPFDVNVGGEQVTVTAIAGTSSPQTFTVTRSVNGAVLAHVVGTAVRLWKPPVYAM
jgi:hypothetical protein